VDANLYNAEAELFIRG